MKTNTKAKTNTRSRRTHRKPLKVKTHLKAGWWGEAVSWVWRGGW